MSRVGENLDLAEKSIRIEVFMSHAMFLVKPLSAFGNRVRPSSK